MILMSIASTTKNYQNAVNQYCFFIKRCFRAYLTSQVKLANQNHEIRENSDIFSIMIGQNLCFYTAPQCGGAV